MEKTFDALKMIIKISDWTTEYDAGPPAPNADTWAIYREKKAFKLWHLGRPNYTLNKHKSARNKKSYYIKD